VEPVVGEPAEEIEWSWEAAAKRRLGEIERGEIRTIPWSEARDRIFAR
jgi:hypothetical protein